MMGFGFLEDGWDVLDSADAERKKRIKAAAEPENVAQAEGYDPQKTETQTSLLSGYMEAPVAPWEKEKAEQSTGEYWAKNLLGINSLFSPSARKAHMAREVKYEDAQVAARAAEAAREAKLGANAALIDNLYNDGDDSNNIQGILDWQVNTGQDLDFDTLSAMDPTNPLFANSSGNTASASARNKYFQPEPFIDQATGRFGIRQYTKDGSEAKVTMLPEGQVPMDMVISPQQRNDMWKEASGEYTTERAALASAETALEKVQSVSEEEWSAGLAGNVETFWKTKITGNTDQEQWAKKQAMNVRNLQQIGLLPPGPATDRDVEIVMRGAPSDNASQKEWVEYLTSVSNLRRISSAVADKKLEHLGTQQGKMFGMAGFDPRNFMDDITTSVYGEQKTAPAVEAPQFKVGDTYDGRKFLGGDPNDIKSWEEITR